MHQDLRSALSRRGANERDGRTKRSFAPAVDRARRRSARHSRVVSATLEGARVAASARVTMNAASAEDEDEE